MSIQEKIKQLDREIKAIDMVNQELLDDISKLEISIKKKELILKKLKLKEQDKIINSTF